VGWIYLAQDTDQWQDLVYIVTKFWVKQKSGYFSRRTLLYELFVLGTQKIIEILRTVFNCTTNLQTHSTI